MKKILSESKGIQHVPPAESTRAVIDFYLGFRCGLYELTTIQNQFELFRERAWSGCRSTPTVGSGFLQTIGYKQGDIFPGDETAIIMMIKTVVQDTAITYGFPSLQSTNNLMDTLA